MSHARLTQDLAFSATFIYDFAYQHCFIFLFILSCLLQLFTTEQEQNKKTVTPVFKREYFSYVNLVGQRTSGALTAMRVLSLALACSLALLFCSPSLRVFAIKLPLSVTGVVFCVWKLCRRLAWWQRSSEFHAKERTNSFY